MFHGGGIQLLWGLVCREVSLTFQKPSLQHQVFKWLPPYPSSHLFPLWFACRAHKREVKERLSCWSQELEIEMEIAWLVRSVSLKAVTALTFPVLMLQRSLLMLARISCPCHENRNSLHVQSVRWLKLVLSDASHSLWPVCHSCSEVLGAQLMAECRILLLYPLTCSPSAAVLNLAWEGRDFS